MNQFKLLEKANKYHEQIKRLDKEIIEIDRIALLFAQEDQEITIDMCRFFEKEQQSKEAEEYNTMSYLSSFSLLIPYGANNRRQESKQQDSFKTQITNKSALLILGVLLQDKHFKRDRLVSRVNEIIKEATTVAQ